MNTINNNQTIINLAGNEVSILKDGLYDRFHSNPPLAIIENESPEIDLSWFKTIKKVKKNVGFETYSPNFYYKNSSITAIYTADLKQLKALMPDKIKNIVQPISIFPNRGLIAITAYAYHYCDNDVYNELSISIATTKPNSTNFGVFSLLGQLKNKNLWGYVLKLPVNTDLARVRGVVGYNLPKWKIPIDYKENNKEITFDFYDEQGNLDFTMIGKKLEIENNKPTLTRSNFINLNKEDKLTHGFNDTRVIQKASSSKQNDVQLNLSNGALSSYIKSLDLGRLIRYDYQPDFQAALYTPEIIESK